MMRAITAQRTTTSFNWRTLLLVATAVDLSLLLATTIALRDLLSLALLLIILTGTLLRRFRGGLVGLIVLALVFADLTAYTLTGTISNVRYHEDILALFLPASLAAASMVGLISAVATAVTRHNPLAGERAARFVGWIAVSFFASVMISGLVFGSSPRVIAPAEHTDLAMVTENMIFSHSELTAEAGQVTLSLTNHDLFWHTFTIDELKVNVETPVRSERQLTFTAEPGIYTFYCAIPGHKALGMVGTLTIR